MLTTTILTAIVAFILGAAAGHLASARTTAEPDLIIHITSATTDPWPPSELDEFMRSYRRHPSTQFTRETEKE